MKAPFAPLPEIGPAARDAVRAQALRANGRYLLEFVEAYAFCPYARGGRRNGQTARYVYLHEGDDLQPLLSLMAKVAADPSQVVAQVIMPLIEVDPDAWITFCEELTALGHMQIGGAPVLACAALHPRLRFSDANAFSMVPLFRRAPDPTIQWARLDGLQALYAGRDSAKHFVDIDDPVAWVRAAAVPRPPLYERVTVTNARMAEQLTVARVVQILDELADSARRGHERALFATEPESSATEAGEEEAPDVESPRPRVEPIVCPPDLPLAEGEVAVARWSELVDLVPRAARVLDVDLIVIRDGDEVHVLHGRCPHRGAPLLDAEVRGRELVCAVHGWAFSFASGDGRRLPGESLARFPARIDHAFDLVITDSGAIGRWLRQHPQAFLRGEYLGS